MALVRVRARVRVRVRMVRVRVRAGGRVRTIFLALIRGSNSG